jgi:6-phosphogluconolactonase
MATSGLPGDERQVDDVPQAFAALVASEAPSSIALSGGDTARRCYELLATADVDWRSVDVWFGDERWVPIHDPESNEGMSRVTFLDEVEPHEIHSMYGAGDTIEAAAAAYDAALRDAPPISLLHLGMGPDGHTASLFPGGPELEETERLMVPVHRPDLPQPWRVSMTLPVLNAARRVLLLAGGAGKAAAVARAVAGDPAIPAGRVRPAGELTWVVTEDAAGRLARPVTA